MAKTKFIKLRADDAEIAFCNAVAKAEDSSLSDIVRKHFISLGEKHGIKVEEATS